MVKIKCGKYRYAGLILLASIVILVALITVFDKPPGKVGEDGKYDACLSGCEFAGRLKINSTSPVDDYEKESFHNECQKFCFEGYSEG